LTERLHGPLRRAAVMRLVQPPDAVVISVPARAWYGQVANPEMTEFTAVPDDGVRFDTPRELGRLAAAGTGGFFTALVAGIAPGLVLPAMPGLVAGLVAGVLAGIGGRAATAYCYDRVSDLRDEAKKEARDGRQEETSGALGVVRVAG